ncbi:efflux RND transporter periplasmic adaptor subunit [bacterium]|nr:efflux RND transporter periplasmic adaptor subunit [bacterium]
MGQERRSGRAWAFARRLFIYAGLLLGAAALAKVFLLSPRDVTTAPVREQAIVAEVAGTGTVTTKVLAKVGSKLTGRVDKVLVDEGDTVKEGQLVALLEDTDLRHQVDRARARVEAAKATAQQTKHSWERAQALIRSGALSREEHDVYQEKFRVAESAIGVEEADLRYHEFKVSETRVVASAGGLVTRRWVEAGDAVVAGQPVVSVADTSVIWVDAHVDQRFSGKVRKDQAATVVLRGRADKPFKGRVARVYPEADPVTEEMLVQVAFPLPPSELQVGQWAEVFIEVGSVPNALVVPKAAVMPFGNDRFVFIADPDGTVRKVQVVPGATSPRAPVVAVTGGVNAGEQVIVKPIGLKGGEMVRVTPPSTGP